MSDYEHYDYEEPFGSPLIDRGRTDTMRSVRSQDTVISEYECNPCPGCCGGRFALSRRERHVDDPLSDAGDDGTRAGVDATRAAATPRPVPKAHGDAAAATD